MRKQKRTQCFIAILLTLCMLATVGCGNGAAPASNSSSGSDGGTLKIQGGASKAPLMLGLLIMQSTMAFKKNMAST